MRALVIILVGLLTLSLAAVAEDKEGCDLNEPRFVEQLQQSIAALTDNERNVLRTVAESCRIEDQKQYRDEESDIAYFKRCSDSFNKWRANRAGNLAQQQVDQCVLALNLERLFYSLGGSTYRSRCKLLYLDPNRNVEHACSSIEQKLKASADSINRRAAQLTAALN